VLVHLAKRYQSLCAEAMCDILLSESKPDEALPFALLSFDITEELAALSPLDSNIQDDLFVLHTKIAKVHKLRGDFDACLLELELTLELAERALTQSSGSLQATGNYSSILARLGDACLVAKKPGLAVSYLERMLENQAKIPEEKRQDADARRLLVNAHSLLGQAYIDDGKPQNAYQTLVTARDLAQAMVDDDMRTEQMGEDLQEIKQLLDVCRESVAVQRELE
jgi:tetratricopeptide (TPR) repeat protein